MFDLRLEPQNPQKIKLATKMVKNDSIVIISLTKFEFLKHTVQHTGCVRDCDLKRKKYRTPDFLGFFGFVKTIKLLITQKKIKTQAQNHS